MGQQFTKWQFATIKVWRLIHKNVLAILKKIVGCTILDCWQNMLGQLHLVSSSTRRRQMAIFPHLFPMSLFQFFSLLCYRKPLPCFKPPLLQNHLKTHFPPQFLMDCLDHSKAESLTIISINSHAQYFKHPRMK